MTPQTTENFTGTAGRGRVALPVLVSVLFLCVTLGQAHLKLLWGDEFVTYWIGQQRSFSQIWRALGSGADPNPPLMHILNWASTSAFGSSAVAVRLPSILAMGLALTCLWLYLRRWLAPVYAAAGCLALMTTRGFDYAYDARSYSLITGFAMAALLCWARSREATTLRRAGWLVGLALALAAGLSSNYYGVLAFFPIAAGELAELRLSRRFRVGTWLAMAVAALPLLAYRQLIRLNLAEFGPHAWNKPQLSMVSNSYLVIVEGILWPVLFLAGLWLYRGRRSPVAAAHLPASHQERVALCVLLAYPVLGFLIAFAGKGMISPRCAAPVCLGVVIAGSFLLARQASRPVAGFMVAFLCLWVVARQAACGYVLLQQRHAFFHLRDQVEQAAAPGETVVVGDSLLVMPLYWYGSAGLRRQLVFPIDFKAINLTESDDSGEQNLWGGRHGVFPVAIGTPGDLLSKSQEMIVAAPPHGWLVKAMQQQGYTLRELPARFDPSSMGGVFTPLDHEQTRVFIAVP